MVWPRLAVLMAFFLPQFNIFRKLPKTKISSPIMFLHVARRRGVDVNIQ